MKSCLKCDGEGVTHTLIPSQPIPCWVCEGKGYMPAPELTPIVEVVLNQRKQPHKILYAPHKQALTMIGKRGPWGKTPHTLEAAEALWKATIFGRRCTYVHMMLQHAIDPRTKLRPLIVHSCSCDPYAKELNALVGILIDAKIDK